MKKKRLTNPRTENDFTLRLQRAQSWFAKAENAEDKVTRFMALWVSFNALYATKTKLTHTTNKADFNLFLKRICQLDKDKIIFHILLNIYSNQIRNLLNDQYTMQSYWDCVHDREKITPWNNEKLLYSIQRMNKALQYGDTKSILRIIFDRIYTLRNQIFHGGMDFFNAKNPRSIENSSDILTILLPVIFYLMEKNAQINWGESLYH